MNFSERELLLALTFSAQALGASNEEIYEFTRCVRPDGSVYGTRGKCRKGTETSKEPEKTKPKEKKGGRGTGDQVTGKEKNPSHARVVTYL